jgi:hypothetical protein
VVSATVVFVQPVPVVEEEVEPLVEEETKEGVEQEVKPVEPVTHQRKSAKEHKPSKRIGRSMYIATANNGRFGIIDRNQAMRGLSELLVHEPRNPQKVNINFRLGETLILQGLGQGSPSVPVRIQFVSASKYFSPGVRVSSCVIGVDQNDWENFKFTHTKKPE